MTRGLPAFPAVSCARAHTHTHTHTLYPVRRLHRVSAAVLFIAESTKRVSVSVQCQLAYHQQLSTTGQTQSCGKTFHRTVPYRYSSRASPKHVAYVTTTASSFLPFCWRTKCSMRRRVTTVLHREPQHTVRVHAVKSNISNRNSLFLTQNSVSFPTNRNISRFGAVWTIVV